MTLSIPDLKLLWRSALALLGATIAVLLTSNGAWAAGPRPLFQMPVPCGQTWDASTYTNHWTTNSGPHPNAIDLSQYNGAGDNISEAEFALASAKGTVESVNTVNEEHRVRIDHGGGWKTDYIHLKELPTSLTVGRKVAQGEVIGRVGHSGTESPHLHYNQLKDGLPDRVAFNGQLIDTWEGNLDSYWTAGTDDAESLTSMNCPGNSFVPFTMNGDRYQFLYKPSTALMKIVRLDDDATGVTTTYSAYSDKRFTHFVPFTLSGGQQHLFSYMSSTGEFRFDRFDSQGEGMTLLEQGTWGAAWTHVTPFTLGSTQYLLVYDSLDGDAKIERINNAGDGTTNIYSDTWERGRTTFTPYVLGGVQYLLLYEGGTGEVEINKLTGSGNNVTITETWSDEWTTGWTSFVPLKHDGSVHLFGYKAATGQVTYDKFKSNGLGTEHLGSDYWTTQWTSFTPFLQDGDGALFAYKGSVGTAHTRLLNNTGSGSNSLWTDDWTTNWT